MKRILSIDGGGIRGLIPALLLAEIEKRTKNRIARMFDLIAGTSTGGILALGLTRTNSKGEPRYSATDLAKLYETHGKQIFSRSAWRAVFSVGGVTDEKYSHEGLENVLEKYFKSEPIGSAVTNVLVSAYDIQNRNPYFFKSWHPENRTVEMSKVARATSAAPTYFEPALIAVGGSSVALVDGGVFVNNPAMSAYAEARKLFKEETEFVVVSLGTGALVRSISFEEAKDWGKAEWAIPILSVVFDGVSDAVDYQLRQILGDRLHRFQIDLAVANDDMDDASKANLEALKLEAARLIDTHREEMDAVCKLLANAHKPTKARVASQQAARGRDRVRKQPSH